MSNDRLTHLDETGRPRMVDVSGKPQAPRRAVASAVVRIGEKAFQLLTAGGLKKGDPLSTAQIAGVMAAKRTSELIPLCHGLSPEYVDVRFTLQPPDGVRIEAEARIVGKTGVELEALMAASVAALTLYDMCKAVSKDIVIGPVQLEEKTGGRSGDWRRVSPA
jgi:cyclic pyranopterin phosphate synthase